MSDSPGNQAADPDSDEQNRQSNPESLTGGKGRFRFKRGPIIKILAAFSTIFCAVAFGTHGWPSLSFGFAASIGGALALYIELRTHNVRKVWCKIWAGALWVFAAIGSLVINDEMFAKKPKPSLVFALRTGDRPWDFISLTNDFLFFSETNFALTRVTGFLVIPVKSGLTNKALNFAVMNFSRASAEQVGIKFIIPTNMGCSPDKKWIEQPNLFDGSRDVLTGWDLLDTNTAGTLPSIGFSLLDGTGALRGPSANEPLPIHVVMTTRGIEPVIFGFNLLFIAETNMLDRPYIALSTITNNLITLQRVQSPETLEIPPATLWAKPRGGDSGEQARNPYEVSKVEDFIGGTKVTHEQLRNYFPFGYVVFYYDQTRQFKYNVYKTGKIEWRMNWDEVKIMPDFSESKVDWTFPPFNGEGGGLSITSRGYERINSTTAFRIGLFALPAVFIKNQPTPFAGILSDDKINPVFVVGMRMPAQNINEETERLFKNYDLK